MLCSVFVAASLDGFMPRSNASSSRRRPRTTSCG